MPKTNTERQNKFMDEKKKLGLINCCGIWATKQRKAQFKRVAKADEDKIIKENKNEKTN